MLKKVLSYGVVGLLAVSLVAGTVYILVRPAEAQAERGPVGGQGQGRGSAGEAAGVGQGAYGQGAGQRASGRGSGGQGLGSAGSGGGLGNGAGNRGGEAAGPGGGGNGRGGGQGQGAAGKGGTGNGRGQGAGGVLTGEGTGLENPADTWITVSGTVVAFEDELSVETAEGEVEVGTGPAWFWDENGIALNAGDELVLYGFYEGDEFELGAIENVTTGEALTLRDEAGRPLWAGRGRFAN
jgi:hypothetical protein